MTTTARALWVVGEGRVELREELMRAPTVDEVLVETRCSGISRGTEGLVLGGRVPASLRQEMRAPWQDGEFPAPVKYGYAAVGVVTAGAPALVGKTVFALHPHQDRFVLPVSAVHVVPDGVPARRAVLAANVETALNGSWDAAVGVGDRVAVIGAGTVGLAVALLLSRMPGIELEVVEVSERRRALAASLGLSAVTPGAARAECDVVVHASGRASGLAVALELAGVEAKVLELSWFGAGDVGVPLGEAFHARRLQIVSSQVGRVSPGHRARWTHARRLGMALRLLEDARFDGLLGDDVGFGELARRYAGILGEGEGAPTPVVAY